MGRDECVLCACVRINHDQSVEKKKRRNCCCSVNEQ